MAASGTHPSASPHGGSKLAAFNSYTSASGSQTRLYRSSGIAVGNYGTVTLSFWMYHDTGYTTYADRVQAQVSTNGTTWTNVGTAVNRYTGATGWAQATVDISAYRNVSSLQVAFLGISAYGNDCYLDDVLVTGSGTPPVTYSVSGTITLSGSGLSGVTVTAGASSGTTNSSGAYTISGLANGTYTVTPSLSGYTFSPTSQSVTVSGANVTGINFTATATGGELVTNGGFESGTTGWTFATYSSVTSGSPYAGTYKAQQLGRGTTTSTNFYQAIPGFNGATKTLRFYLKMSSAEGTTTAYDYLYIRLKNTSGTTVSTLATYSNRNKTTYAGWTLVTLTVPASALTNYRISFDATEDSSLQTTFYIDGVSIQ
jgi:hypothetical protein